MWQDAGQGFRYFFLLRCFGIGGVFLAVAGGGSPVPVQAAIGHVQQVREFFVDFKGESQRVTYSIYVPPHEEGRLMPVLVCIGGLPMNGEDYAQSDAQECTDESWLEFADKHQMMILGLGFLFIEKDWPNNESYQYPQVWSGRALMDVLDIIEKDYPIDRQALYMFGISAGAQYSVRLAQQHPDMVKAVAAHAAGGFDPPKEHIPVRFLITVGEFDNQEITRLEFAKIFAEQCRVLGIDLTLEIIPGIAHRQTEAQNEMSRRFFSDN